MDTYFITGTDTGIGKTFVSTALLSAARERGLRTRCLKPVESGCSQIPDGSLVPRDACSLWEATAREQDRESVCIYRFAAAVAPGVAAEREGRYISFDRIRKQVERICEESPDVFLIEGAGGLLVPMGNGRLMSDLILCLGFPILIVAHPGLGTINHTLLTIEAARSRGLDVRAVIFSASTADVVLADAVISNAEEIEKASAIPVLGCLPHQRSNTSPRELASVAEISLDLEAIFSSCGRENK